MKAKMSGSMWNDNPDQAFSWATKTEGCWTIPVSLSGWAWCLCQLLCHVYIRVLHSLKGFFLSARADAVQWKSYCFCCRIVSWLILLAYLASWSIFAISLEITEDFHRSKCAKIGSVRCISVCVKNSVITIKSYIWRTDASNVLSII